MRVQSGAVPSIFITGPVRSGKSAFAERLARERASETVYIATGPIDPLDDEWLRRIAAHAKRRPATWRVVETAAAGSPTLAELANAATAGQTLLVDSLGTWLSSRMSRFLDDAGESAALDEHRLEEELNAAVDALAATAANAIVIGDEVGWGLVPPFPSGRVFRDVLGRGQQRMAARSVRAYLVVAGFALDLAAHGVRVGATQLD